MGQLFLSASNQYKTIKKRGIAALLLLLLASIFIVVSCAKDKEEIPDGLPEVIRQLESNSGTCDCAPFIDQFLWKNKTVYLLRYRGPVCNWIPTFYDEQGHPFLLESGYSFESFLQVGKRIIEVWSCQ